MAVVLERPNVAAKAPVAAPPPVATPSPQTAQGASVEKKQSRWEGFLRFLLVIDRAIKMGAKIESASPWEQSRLARTWWADAAIRG